MLSSSLGVFRGFIVCSLIISILDLASMALSWEQDLQQEEALLLWNGLRASKVVLLLPLLVDLVVFLFLCFNVCIIVFWMFFLCALVSQFLWVSEIFRLGLVENIAVVVLMVIVVGVKVNCTFAEGIGRCLFDWYLVVCYQRNDGSHVVVIAEFNGVLFSCWWFYLMICVKEEENFEVRWVVLFWL